jgi:PAS domain S-box-containing protein
VIGRDLDDLFPPPVARAHREIDERVRGRDRPVRWRLPIGRNGADALGEASGYSFPLVEGVGSCYVDDTEIASVRERLSRSEQLYRGLFERSSVPTAIYGLDQRVRDANPAYCRLLGYRRSEIVGLHVRQLITSATAVQNSDRWIAVVQGRLDGYRTLSGGVRRDGTVVAGQTIVSLVRDPEGRPSLIYAVSDPAILATDGPVEQLPARSGIRLSRREIDVLEGVAEGLSSSDVARRLGLSTQGVEYHVRKLMELFGVPNRPALVGRVYALGVLVPGLWPPRATGHVAADLDGAGP